MLIIIIIPYFRTELFVRTCIELFNHSCQIRYIVSKQTSLLSVYPLIVNGETERVNSLFETVSNYGCILLSMECHLAANNFSVFPLSVVFFENRTRSIFQLSKYFCIMRICTYLAATSAWNVYAEMAVS